MLPPNRSELGYRSSGNRDRELLARLGATQDLPNAVAELFLRDDRQAR
jgi:hypothetical protein